MKTPVPLDAVSRELLAAFRQVILKTKRAVVLAACEHVVAESGLCGPDVEEAMAVLRRRTRDGDADVCRRMKKLAGRLDTAYLQVSKELEARGWPTNLTLFRRARAACALAFAMDANSENLHESIYEALAACENESRERLIALLREMLSENPT